MDIHKAFSFDSAHRLPHAPEGHKCARLHGHTFRVVVRVSGPVDPVAGWVMDFGDITAVVRPLIEQLDHRYLNEIDGLGNPTSEVLARWLWERIAPALPGLSAIEVHETCTSGVTYRGD